MAATPPTSTSGFVDRKLTKSSGTPWKSGICGTLRTCQLQKLKYADAYGTTKRQHVGAASSAGQLHALKPKADQTEGTTVTVLRASTGTLSNHFRCPAQVTDGPREPKTSLRTGTLLH